MDAKTQQLRKQLIEVAKKTESNVLLEAAYKVLTDTIAWDDLPNTVKKSLERAENDIKAGRLISNKEFREKHGI